LWKHDALYLFNELQFSGLTHNPDLHSRPVQQGAVSLQGSFNPEHGPHFPLLELQTRPEQHPYMQSAPAAEHAWHFEEILLQTRPAQHSSLFVQASWLLEQGSLLHVLVFGSQMNGSDVQHLIAGFAQDSLYIAQDSHLPVLPLH